MPTASLQTANPVYPQCNAKYTVRKGKRRNRLRTLQIFQCAECLIRFTGAAGKSKTYPLKAILEAVSTFNLGHSLTDAQRIIRERTHLQIPDARSDGGSKSISPSLRTRDCVTQDETCTIPTQ
jgi:hypothetical protein